MSAQAEAVRAGAFVVGSLAPLPLEGVRVEASILGLASRVVVSQRYRNAEQGPVEAVYVFPLPEDAALCGLVIVTGGRRVVGEVEERDKAFDRYDDALMAGHGAVLLDQERPNVFTASVGNLLPDQELKVELTYVATLAAEGDALRFVLPTTVSPRYAPAEDRAGVSPTPAELVSPPVGHEVPYGFSFRAMLEIPGGVASVESPSHPIRVSLGGRRVRVELSSGEAAMDRDLVLLLFPRRAREPFVLLERQADGELVGALSFVPRLETGASAPREVVFLVDRSGSMEGSSLEQVHRALQLCLRSLAPGDRFEVVGFGSTFHALFGGSRPFDDESLEAASCHVDGMGADLGGTEILPALEWVLARPPAGELRREVVLLTDGQVSNDEAVIQAARAHAASTRIFSFGIGFGASDHLVRGLARATSGVAEMILPGEAIAPKVMRQVARLRAPTLEDLRVDWGGLAVREQAPHRLLGVFDGEPLVVYGRLREARPVTVRLEGRTQAGPVSWELALDPEGAVAGGTLGALAARAAIRDLEEGSSGIPEHRGSAQRGRRESRLREAIVALATRYRLASSETSFVAVEEREAGEQTAPSELRRVPVALTHGWGGLKQSPCAPRRASAGLTSLDSGVIYEQLALPRAWYEQGSGEPTDPTARVKEPGLLGSLFRLRLPGRARADGPAPSGRDALVRLQRADGSWALDARLAAALGVSLDGLKDLARTIGRGRRAKSLVATAAALHFLETRAAESRVEWALLADKARAWLAKALEDLGPPLDRLALEGAVTRLVGSVGRDGQPG